jgi:hypothetical protein
MLFFLFKKTESPSEQRQCQTCTRMFLRGYYTHGWWKSDNLCTVIQFLPVSFLMPKLVLRKQKTSCWFFYLPTSTNQEEWKKVCCRGFFAIILKNFSLRRGEKLVNRSLQLGVFLKVSSVRQTIVFGCSLFQGCWIDSVTKTKLHWQLFFSQKNGLVLTVFYYDVQNVPFLGVCQRRCFFSDRRRKEERLGIFLQFQYTLIAFKVTTDGWLAGCCRISLVFVQFSLEWVPDGPTTPINQHEMPKVSECPRTFFPVLPVKKEFLRARKN